MHMSFLNHPLFRVISDSIRNKLLVAMSLVAIVPMAALGFVAYYQAARALEASILQHYASVSKDRAEEVLAGERRNVRIIEFTAKQQWLKDQLKQLSDEKG